ncbi:MAG: hypothetical protein NC936_01500 [Candidatus Omnitrophica bacterium]|nr:hypothetical protein [Candidatus Omnitrophota bacterium]
MEQKRRLILIGAALVILIVGFLVMQLYTANQKLTQENTALAKQMNSLKKKNESLESELQYAQKKASDLGEQLSAVQRDLNRFQEVARERDELQRKYEIVTKEKNELADKLAKMRSVEVSRPAVTAPPVSGLGEDVYWASILKEKTNLEVSLSKIKDELKALKVKFDEQQKIKATLESEIKNLKEIEIKNLINEKSDLERRLAYSERTIDSLSMELVREKKDNRKLKEDLKAIGEEKEALRKQMEILRKQIADLDNQIKTLNDNKAVLEDKLEKIELAKQDLEKRVMAVNALLDEKTSEIMDLKQKLDLIKQEQGLLPEEKPRPPQASVELPPIVVRPSAGSSALPVKKEISGKIVEINHVNNFVILDIGEDEGVKPGTILNVYRGNNRIATLEVIQTRKSICAADIKQVTQTIKVGDTVKQ